MVFESILTDLENGILTVTLNRPQALNALNERTFIELRAVFEDVPNNENISGVIITGMGDKAFAAGADIKEFMNFDVEQGKHLARNGQEVFFMIERCPKPVIAAVNGFALGGGCELSMACHLRIASPNARFGQPEVNLGLTPGYAGTQRLVQLIGKSKALELLMTADAIKADQAMELGLVNHVVEQEHLHEFCYELLEKITSKSPVAIAGVIECVNAYYEEGMDGFDKEIEVFGECFGTEDFKEGTDAFINKRKARFTGK
jgi:enoyl-CoA hydratase